MRISLSLLASVLLLASIALGVGVSKTPSPEAQAIRSLVDEYARYCQEKDLEGMGRIFANSPDTIMISATGPRVTMGWNMITAGYRSFFQNVTNFKTEFAIHTVKVFAGGKAACLTAHQEATMTVNSNPVAFKNVRMTWLLEKSEGQWRIVNAHWSVAQRP